MAEPKKKQMPAVPSAELIALLRQRTGLMQPMPQGQLAEGMDSGYAPAFPQMPSGMGPRFQQPPARQPDPARIKADATIRQLRARAVRESS